MEAKRAVWVVVGEVGSYSDHEEWVVAVHICEQLAIEHAQRAKDRGAELTYWTDSKGERFAYSDEKEKPRNEYDPSMATHAIWLEAPDYSVVKSSLLAGVPKVAKEGEVG